MSEPRYTHSMSPEKLLKLLLYQANQFELFKNFVIEMLDSRNIVQATEFETLFEEFTNLNKTKFLHNLIMLNPTLEDMRIDVSLL